MNNFSEWAADFWCKWWKLMAILLGSCLLVTAIYYFACLNHVTLNEVGIGYNSLNGQVTVQKAPGWYRTSPFVKVTYINTLPMTVTIPSSARIIVSKVVRFKIEGVDEYIRLQGFSYGMNSSLNSTLLGYAFSGRDYPFLEIMQEAQLEKVNTDPLYKR